MSCVGNEQLRIDILICISKYTMFDRDTIEYAYNKLKSIDLLIETIDYASVNNLELGQAAHNVMILKENTDNSIIKNIIGNI